MTAQDLARLMQYAAGFRFSQVLTTAEKLNLFGLLAAGDGLTEHEIHTALAIADRPAGMLLTACRSLGLIEEHAGRFRNTELSNTYLVPGERFYLGAIIRFIDHIDYLAWARLEDAVRTNTPVMWTEGEHQGDLISSDDPQVSRLFQEAQHSIGTFTAHTLASKVDLSKASAILDVGGGTGAISSVLCRRYPGLRATIYDLPHVRALAQHHLDNGDVAGRVAFTAGDFINDTALPQGHDVIVLSSILHDWDAGTGAMLLRKCFDALPDDGIVLVLEQLLDDDRSGPLVAAMMNLEMLIQTSGGRNCTEGEYQGMVRDAGFTDVHTVRFVAAGANGAIIGRKS